MKIHEDRLSEMLDAPREAMICKAEIAELIHAYRNYEKQLLELGALFEHATGYSFEGYTRMLDEVKEEKPIVDRKAFQQAHGLREADSPPWADLQMRIPDSNCLMPGIRGPRCRYCGEWYADADSDAGHARNCNRPLA